MRIKMDPSNRVAKAAKKAASDSRQGCALSTVTRAIPNKRKAPAPRMTTKAWLAGAL